MIKTLTFNEENNPRVLELANEVAELEDRKPHDSAARILEEALVARLAELKDGGK